MDRRLLDSFGRLKVSPEYLPREDRIDVLRSVAGQLQADSAKEFQWLGECLTEWLVNGGPLDGVLGVRAEPGSHLTAQSRVRQHEVDNLLVRLSVIAGGDRRALAQLRGLRPCSSEAAPLIDRLRALKAPASVSAFTRARSRSAPPR